MVEVVAALIWSEGRFLICQRPQNKARGLKWEFVGGKVENGESKRDALKRECKEELDIDIEVGEKFFSVEHEYPDVTIRLFLYSCVILGGELRLLEHNAIKWILPEEIANYDFCPADEKILEKIKSTFCGEHSMRLADLPFDKIKSGEKKIEARLNDVKRRTVKTGDIIWFSRNSNPFEKLKMQVVGLHLFDSFADLFSKFSDKTGGEFDMYKYYTREDEQKYGVLGIELKRAQRLKIEHYSWHVNSIYRLFDKTELLGFVEGLQSCETDPAKMRLLRVIIKDMCVDGEDMPQSPSWEYWEFGEAAVKELLLIVKKSSDRRCDLVKRAKSKLERAKGRDKEIFERIIYELKAADDRQIEGLKEYKGV